MSSKGLKDNFGPSTRKGMASKNKNSQQKLKPKLSINKWKIVALKTSISYTDSSSSEDLTTIVEASNNPINIGRQEINECPLGVQVIIHIYQFIILNFTYNERTKKKQTVVATVIENIEIRFNEIASDVVTSLAQL